MKNIWDRNWGAGVDPTAAVHRDSRIGVGVRIGSDARVGPDVRIGWGTELARGTIVHAGARIGQGCRIGEGARIGEGGRIAPRVTIGDGSRMHAEACLRARVQLGPNVVVGRRTEVLRGVTVPSYTRLPDGSRIDATSLAGLRPRNDIEVQAERMPEMSALLDEAAKAERATIVSAFRSAGWEEGDVVVAPPSLAGLQLRILEQGTPLLADESGARDAPFLLEPGRTYAVSVHDPTGLVAKKLAMPARRSPTGAALIVCAQVGGRLVMVANRTAEIVPFVARGAN